MNHISKAIFSVVGNWQAFGCRYLLFTIWYLVFGIRWSEFAIRLKNEAGCAATMPLQLLSQCQRMPPSSIVDEALNDFQQSSQSGSLSKSKSNCKAAFKYQSETAFEFNSKSDIEIFSSTNNLPKTLFDCKRRKVSKRVYAYPSSCCACKWLMVLIFGIIFLQICCICEYVFFYKIFH